MNKILLFSLILLINSSSFAQGSTEFRLSLKQAVDYAMENNYDLRTASINHELSDQIVNEVYAIGLPQVSAGLDYQNFFQLPTSLIPAEFFGGPEGSFAEIQFGTKQNTNLKFQASQLLFDGRFFIGLKATKDVLATNALAEKYAAVPIREKVVKGYYTALLTQQSLLELQKTLETTKKIQAETKAYYDAGFAQQLDVDRMQLAVNNLQTQIDNLNKNSETANAALKYILGMPQENVLVLSDSLSLLTNTVSLNDKPVADPSNRLEFQLIEKQITLQGYNVRQSKAAYLPTLVAFASVSTSAQRDKFNFFNDGRWYPTGLWGLNLSIPIFDGLKTATQVKKAKLSLALAKQSKLSFEEGQQLQINAAYTAYANAYANLESEKANVELARKIHDKTYIMFREGVGNSLDLSTSEASLVQSQLNYVQAIYQLLMAKADLDLAKGEL